MSYEQAQVKYAYKEGELELFRRLIREEDFQRLDYCLEGCEGTPTAEQVEEILDRFSEEINGNEYVWQTFNDTMREVIDEVLGEELV